VPTAETRTQGNTGSSILRLLIGFNNGHYHSHDLNAWLIASNPPDVLATNLGLPRTVAEALPEETLFIARHKRIAEA
jgi:oxalate decarboxylase